MNLNAQYLAPTISLSSMALYGVAYRQLQGDERPDLYVRQSDDVGEGVKVLNWGRLGRDAYGRIETVQRNEWLTRLVMAVRREWHLAVFAVLMWLALAVDIEMWFGGA